MKQFKYQIPIIEEQLLPHVLVRNSDRICSRSKTHDVFYKILAIPLEFSDNLFKRAVSQDGFLPHEITKFPNLSRNREIRNESLQNWTPI